MVWDSQSILWPQDKELGWERAWRRRRNPKKTKPYKETGAIVDFLRDDHSTLVQLGLCINLFFTLPLMMNPVFEVVERRFCGSTYSLWVRWLLVFGVSLVALLVPNFADFLSLVGSSVCVALGFVLPALFHLMVFRDELSWFGSGLDGCIVVVGVVIGVSGTWSSVAEIIAPKA